MLSVCDQLVAQHFGAAPVPRAGKVAEDVLREQVADILLAERFTARACEIANLIGRADVALEQDHAPRLRVAKERALRIAQRKSRKSCDEGPSRHAAD